MIIKLSDLLRMEGTPKWLTPVGDADAGPGIKAPTPPKKPAPKKEELDLTKSDPNDRKPAKDNDEDGYDPEDGPDSWKDFNEDAAGDATFEKGKKLGFNMGRVGKGGKPKPREKYDGPGSPGYKYDPNKPKKEGLDLTKSDPNDKWPAKDNDEDGYDPEDSKFGDSRKDANEGYGPRVGLVAMKAAGDLGIGPAQPMGGSAGRNEAYDPDTDPDKSQYPTYPKRPGEDNEDKPYRDEAVEVDERNEVGSKIPSFSTGTLKTREGAFDDLEDKTKGGVFGDMGLGKKKEAPAKTHKTPVVKSLPKRTQKVNTLPKNR